MRPMIGVESAAGMCTLRCNHMPTPHLAAHGLVACLACAHPGMPCTHPQVVDELLRPVLGVRPRFPTHGRVQGSLTPPDSPQSKGSAGECDIAALPRRHVCVPLETIATRCHQTPIAVNPATAM